MSEQRHNEPEVATSRLLSVLLVFYGLASLLHFSHNAEFVADYPNLPDWLSPASIYLAWSCITTVGVGGYLLVRHGQVTVGRCLIGVYAALGFDGLLHYRQAPFTSHTTAMNVTVLLQLCAAALLLVAVSSSAIRRPARGG